MPKNLLAICVNTKRFLSGWLTGTVKAPLPLDMCAKVSYYFFENFCMDFSGRYHLFAIQLSPHSCMAFLLPCIPKKPSPLSEAAVKNRLREE